MAQYMLLIRGDDEVERSPEEMQGIVQEYIAWARRLQAEGRMHGGDELASSGKVVRKQGDRLLVSDGPYAEGKELVGGYFLIDADSDDHAAQIAGECPGLRRNGAVEVRAVVDHS
jgi:hypothetical protein